jgi:hypothetical protein
VLRVSEIQHVQVDGGRRPACGTVVANRDGAGPAIVVADIGEVGLLGRVYIDVQSIYVVDRHVHSIVTYLAHHSSVSDSHLEPRAAAITRLAKIDTISMDPDVSCGRSRNGD